MEAERNIIPCGEPIRTPAPLKPRERLLLASASPRRAQILRDTGIPFDIQPVDIDEKALQEHFRLEHPNHSPADLVRHLATVKAEALAQLRPGHLALGADTVVELDGLILGKPRDLADAKDTLRALSGRVNRVFSGVAFARLVNGALQTDARTACTQVRFRKLSEETIERYVSLVNPLDKAGSYALQDHGEMLIEAVEGSVSNVIGLPLELAMRGVRGTLLDETTRRRKARFDTLAALVLLLGFAPLLGALWLLVKLSGHGPALFLSQRLGQFGRPIRVLKFRTMRADADASLERLLSESPEKAREWRERHKMRHDPRITAVGRFLRQTSLDELPQLWNVLRGEMSLVGPRPIVPEEIPKYGTNYELLAQVRPGMTGLWQVSGRSRLAYSRRVALDIQYILHRTWSLDLRILWRTLPEIIRGRGAW